MKMDQALYIHENIFAHFPPILRTHFLELLTNGKVGLSPFTINDIISVKQYSENNSLYSYSYTLKVPYAGKRLTWELIFDPEDIKFAPDLNFNDNYFAMIQDLDLMATSIPSLANWNVYDPKCLTSVIKEFIELLKKCQLEKLKHENIFAAVNTEYEGLIKEIPLNNIELLLDYSSVHFVINLKVNIAGLPLYIQPGNPPFEAMVNPGEDTCILKISYLKLDASQTTTSLQLSPHLDQVLGGAKVLQIPSFTKTTTMVAYVKQVNKLLNDHIKRIKQHNKLKRTYITTLSTLYGGMVLEFDSVTFNSAKLLMEAVGNYCVVNIEIDPTFPEEMPTVTLQSLYCLATKRLCSKEIGNYPYSSKWQPTHMLAELMKYIEGEIAIFKNHKH